MRVLVTGADGFVGRHLVAALAARGDEVAPAGGPAATDVVPLDVTDPVAVRGVVEASRPDAVVHLAGQASVGASVADPVGTFAVNAVGTLHLLEALRAGRDAGAPAARIVIASSAEVYGVQPPEGLPLRETLVPRPATPYAASKLAAEAVTLAHVATYGTDAVVTRAFNHLGPGQDARFVVPSFAAQLAAIAAGAPPLLRVGNLATRRDMTDVRDVVDAYLALLDRRGDAGAIYNVCSGRAPTIGEILGDLIRIAGVGVEVREDPGRLRPSDVPVLVGDPSRLHDATGWRARRTLAATLREVYQDARARATQSGT